MAVTLKADFSFEPQIANLYSSAYFRRRLIFAKLGFMPSSEQTFKETPGDKITFPYYEKMGDAGDYVENQAMEVDKLSDDKFEATIQGFTKAVGRTKAALLAHGNSPMAWEREAHKQIGQLFAEKLDKLLLTKLATAEYADTLDKVTGDVTITTPFGIDKGISDAKVLPQRFNVRSFSSDLIEAFGDKSNECRYAVMHSKQFNDLAVDKEAGFLKADANHPLFGISQFKGTLFGVGVLTFDTVNKGSKITITDSGGATQKFQTYEVLYLKADAYGVFPKRTPNIEYARDILKKNDIMAADQWLAVISFHKRISTEDVRAAKKEYLVNEQTT